MLNVFFFRRSGTLGGAFFFCRVVSVFTWAWPSRRFSSKNCLCRFWRDSCTTTSSAFCFGARLGPFGRLGTFIINFFKSPTLPGLSPFLVASHRISFSELNLCQPNGPHVIFDGSGYEASHTTRQCPPGLIMWLATDWLSGVTKSLNGMNKLIVAWLSVIIDHPNLYWNNKVKI